MSAEQKESLPRLKRAGIVLDKYKLEVFKQGLSNAGYSYEQEKKGPVLGTLTLVELFKPEQVQELTKLVQELNMLASMSPKTNPKQKY